MTMPRVRGVDPWPLPRTTDFERSATALIYAVAALVSSILLSTAVLVLVAITEGAHAEALAIEPDIPAGSSSG